MVRKVNSPATRAGLALQELLGSQEVLGQQVTLEQQAQREEQEPQEIQVALDTQDGQELLVQQAKQE